MSLLGRSREKLKHVKGLVRVFAYFSVIGIGASFCSLRSAHAEVRNNTITVGRQMAELARGPQSEVNRLSINGQSMYVGSALAEGSVKDVLDRYEAHCRANPGEPASSWKELANKPGGEKLKDTAFGSDGVMRTEQGDEGTVVCFTRGEDTKPTALEAMKAFAATGELGALVLVHFAHEVAEVPVLRQLAGKEGFQFLAEAFFIRGEGEVHRVVLAVRSAIPAVGARLARSPGGRSSRLRTGGSRVESVTSGGR